MCPACIATAALVVAGAGEPSLTDPDTVYAGVEDAAGVPLDRRGRATRQRVS